MKTAALVLTMVSALGACRRAESRQPREIGEPQLVALVVRSEPAGASVKVNKLTKTWTTPCDIADFSLGKGVIDLEITMPGYQAVTTKVKYDGYDPAILHVKLLRIGAAEPAAEPAVVAAPPPPPRAATPPAPEAPAPLTVEPTAGGTRLRVNSGASKIRIQAKAVVADPEKPGEYFLPHVPPDKVLVEFLDPKTDAVLQSVEFAPPANAPAAVKAPEAPPVEADRVGEIKLVSKTYGVFVKLDPGLALQPGEEILVFRDGREVARTKILRITKADPAYPDGAAQVQKEGSIQKGDEVRRQKP